MKIAALAVVLAVSARAGQPPKDFDRFWGAVRRELAAVPLEATLEPDAAHTDARAACFKASYRSLGKVLVHARYCRPPGNGPFPAVLISPWYGQGPVEAPRGPAERGVAALWYQGRGYEVDRSSYPLDNSWYILAGIESPKTYVYRSMAAHAMRGLDVLALRPEVDVRKLAVMGASQGGGLSLLLAGLDKRVSLAAADFPFLCDWEVSLATAQPPFGDVRGYIERDPSVRVRTLRTASYFDVLSVAGRIRAPVRVQAGLKDRTCPAAGIKKAYARMGSADKWLVEFPDADHGDRNAERWKAMEDFVVRRLRAP